MNRRRQPESCGRREKREAANRPAQRQVRSIRRSHAASVGAKGNVAIVTAAASKNAKLKRFMHRDGSEHVRNVIARSTDNAKNRFVTEYPVQAKRRLQIEFAGVENVQNVVFWFGLLRDRCGKEAENQPSREREERGRSQMFARQK